MNMFLMVTIRVRYPINKTLGEELTKCRQIKSLLRILSLFDFQFAKSGYHPLVRNLIKMFHQTAKRTISPW